MAAFGKWLVEHWYWIAAMVAMIALSFCLIRLLETLRNRCAEMIRILLQQDPALCAERLEKNKLFPLIFRKPVLYLWKLDAYMACGEADKISTTIAKLDKMSLEPRDKLEFYQKRLSWFAEQGNGEEARKSHSLLRDFLVKVKADKQEPYKTILEEAELIIGVYIDHNTGLIKKLTGRAAHTQNDVMRGVIQYRIAKLAYFKEDQELMETYLNRAAKNLKGSWYEARVAEAMENPQILATK